MIMLEVSIDLLRIRRYFWEKGMGGFTSGEAAIDCKRRFTIFQELRKFDLRLIL
ncbi:MAG: hypothetical protein ACREQV_27065 [Candidatus Binatia bacterium]